MRRPSYVLASIAIAVLAFIPLVAAPAGAQPVSTAGVPTSVAACKHGGWRTLTDPVGASFATRAACIRWATAHPGGTLRLSDLSGTFAGVESFTFECTFVHQTFDASYATRGRVGTATMAIEGCVDGSITTYTGTFSISTPIGSVSGTVAGTLQAVTTPATFHLVLTPTASTGAFTGLSGTLLVEIRWNGFPETAITGTVAAPLVP
ncbi:MAG: hypothetical protein ACXWBN_17165 [Acidimicrobiales bacterium]